MPDKIVLQYLDFSVGREFTSPDYLVTPEDIVRFASEFDPQPCHTDPEISHPLFGQLAASGWHTASLAMRLLTQTIWTEWGVVGAGVSDLRWPAAMRAGDLIHLEVMVLERRELKSKPGLGIVRLGVKVVEKSGRVVLEMDPKVLVPLDAPTEAW